jgi:hypothetical protein
MILLYCCSTARDAVYYHNPETLLAAYENFLSLSASSSSKMSEASFDDSVLPPDRLKPTLLHRMSSGPSRPINLVRVKTGELHGEQSIIPDVLGSSIHANSAFEFRQLRLCAWSLFRLLATLALGGSAGRKEAEATQAAMATTRALKKNNGEAEVSTVFPPNAPDSPVRSPRRTAASVGENSKPENSLIHSIFLTIEREMEMAVAYVSGNGDEGWADIEPLEVEMVRMWILIFLNFLILNCSFFY